MKECVVNDYLTSLNELAEMYDDTDLKNMIEDFKTSDLMTSSQYMRYRTSKESDNNDTE